MPKVEKLNWEPPVALQCKVKINSSLALEKYLETRFEFCDSLIRISATKKIISAYKYNINYLVSRLMKTALSNEVTKASNAFYILMYMSDFTGYLEAKEKKIAYIPKNYLEKSIHAFLNNAEKNDPNCDLPPSYYAVTRLQRDLTEARPVK